MLRAGASRALEAAGGGARTSGSAGGGRGSGPLRSEPPRENRDVF